MKKIFILLICILFIGILPGCGDGTESSLIEMSSEASASSEPVSSTPKPKPTLKEIIDKIYIDLLEGEELKWLREPTETELSDIFALNEEMYDEVYILHTKVITHATRLVGVKVKDGKEEEVRASISAMRDEVDKVFSEEYLPAQHEIVQNSEFIEYDNYIFFIMCENSEEAHEIIDSFF